MANEVAILAGGCFWCTEAVFDEVEGVDSVESGYTGGRRPNPTYEQICTGVTGHAEALRITFDPARVAFRDLLRIFFTVHDPTTLNRQGNDVGTQYRSAIFYRSPEQEQTAREVIREVEAAGLWDGPIVTEVTPASEFYVAEDYHQEYFARNPNQPYCLFAAAPKLRKFRETFPAMRKKKITG